MPALSDAAIDQLLEKEPALSDAAIDQLLEKETRAPDTREYTARFVKKKPAAHKAPVSKKPAAHKAPVSEEIVGAVSTHQRKLKYSRVYHATLTKGLAAGLSAALGKVRARAAARLAVGLSS